MRNTVNSRRLNRVRRALLASTGIVAVAQLPHAALAQTTVEETDVQLSRRSDSVSLININLDIDETTDFFGLTPNIVGTGVDADNGSDRVTVSGVGAVNGSVVRTNNFGLIGALIDFTDFFPSVNFTTAEMTGVEGGFGSNQLTLNDSFSVSSLATASQTDLDLRLTNSLPDLIPISLDSGVSSIARGLHSSRGRSRSRNFGDLDVNAAAQFERVGGGVDLIGFDLSSTLVRSDAYAVGLSGDLFGDMLVNELGGSVSANAGAQATVANLLLQRITIVGANDANQSRAIAAAMAGGGGADRLTNNGALSATATSLTREDAITATVKEASLPTALLPDTEPSSLSLAVATGMDGGASSDRVANNGAINLSADADHLQLGISISDGGISTNAIVTVIEEFAGSGGGEEGLAQGAIAEVVGLRGDERGATVGGADVLTNAGAITGTANAEGVATSISIGVPLSEAFQSNSSGGSPSGGGALQPTAAEKVLDAFGIGFLDYSADAAAFADGVRGGAGGDVIDNSGVIAMTAQSNTIATGVNISGFDVLKDTDPDEPFSVNSAVFNTASNAVARSAGLAGNGGGDMISNTGAISATADADAVSGQYSFTAAFEEKALQIEAPVIISSTSATAIADGIDAGEGYDSVNNAGVLSSNADAFASSTDVTLGVSIIKNGGGVNAVILDKDISALATATGVRDGLGADSVTHTGAINAVANSEATSTSVGLDVVVNTMAGLSLTSGLASADQSAASRAIGVERSLDDLDVDASFVSIGEIDADATATSTRTTVSVDLAATKAGVSFAVPLVSSENTATAEAGALVSFDADDVFTGLADMTATADANATSTGVGVGGAVTLTGVAAGVAAMKTSNTADANATLLDFGAGGDIVTNASVLKSDADAVSRSNAVNVGIGGTNLGVAAGGALVDGTTDAFAAATTIATGDDDDTVINDSDALLDDAPDAEIRAESLADASSTNVGVSVGAVIGTMANPGIGVGLAASLAKAGLTGDADATAVDLGAGADVFQNADIVVADATGKAKTEGVNVALSGSMIGGAISGSLSDTSVTASGEATGVDGGADSDALLNAGTLTATAVGDANTVGVNVSGSVSIGVALGGAGLLSDTRADATAVGMDGGAGADVVQNAGALTADANADAANTSVAVNVNAGVFSAGGAVVSARTTSDALAVGLAGDDDGLNEEDAPTDDAAEDDTVEHLADILTVNSRAQSSAVSVGVSGSYNGFGGVAIIGDTDATSRAIGLFGGSGGDSLLSQSTINIASTALANAPAVSVIPAGGNVGDLNTDANAFAYGMHGGVGGDDLRNFGLLTTNATSDVSGDLVQVTMIGGTVGDLSTVSNATAYGLFGGDGADMLFSDGDLRQTATADVRGTSVAVNLTGASFADVSTVANAVAAGAAGGEGSNTFLLTDTLTSTAVADVNATVTSVNLLGAAFGDEADAGARADAQSFGYLGGNETDAGEIGGTVLVSANATSENDVGAANVVGASFGEMSPIAAATSSFASGEDGGDALTFSGTGTSLATATARGSVTLVELAGAASATAAPEAIATARGLDGGAGRDMLTNNGAATSMARSNIDVGRNRIVVAGASIGSISSTSTADAAGLDGGDDSDTLQNNASLTSIAVSSLDADGVDVTVAGASVDTGDGNLTADADAAGILGGDGEDTAINDGAVISAATAVGGAGVVNVTLAGAGLGNAETTFAARSVGIDGEGDDDTLTNNGVATSTATASAGANSTSVVIFGASDGDTDAAITATSLIMAGGGGGDVIVNNGEGVATSTATGIAQNVEVTVGGALLGDASSRANARAVGVDAGDGDDVVRNTDRFDLNSTAAGRVGRVSVAVAGADGGASVETDIVASAAGIVGGSGADELSNSGEIDVDLQATTNANSSSVVVIGSSAVNAAGGLFSTSDGIGLSGDEDDDEIVNELDGVIDILSRATTNADDSSTNIFGAAALNGLMRARAWGTGLAGGDGNDDLFNFGEIILNADGIANSNGASFTAAGASSAGGDVSGTTRLYGLHGGAGDDFLYNTGALTARSDARGTFRSSSLSAVGFSGGGGAAGADAWTYGFFGDSGLDDILIDGTATSIADARVTLNTNVDVGIGAASSNRSGVEARAYGRGASGGADADTIEVAGALNTFGYAQVSTSNSQFAFVAGSASGSASATSRAEAFAVNGDAGDDTLINNGVILADSESRTTGSGAAGGSIGSTNAASQLVARSNSIGLYGGDGEDTLINNGTITANITTTTKAENTVTNAVIFSDGRAESRSTNNAFGTLFFDSQKSTTIVNTGDAILKHFGNRDSSLRGTSRAFANATGVTGSINVNADSEARAYSNVNLRGVRLGDGSHSVTNAAGAEIKVESFAFSSGAATATGNSSISGDGDARGRAYVNNSRVTGVESLSGALTFDNDGVLDVRNRPDAASSATGRGTGLDILRDPDGRATATIDMNNVHAYGVRSGGLDDTIDNAGTIYVESEPEADRAIARASALGSFSLSVDAFAYATVNVNDAEAYGIHAGDGNNTIVNSGSLTVVSDPYAEARAEATGRGPDGDATAETTANALRAQAYGIITGNGDDTITNTGTISVSATPSRSATRKATVGSLTTCIGVIINGRCIGGTVTLTGEVEGDRTPNGSTSRTIVGVQTGDGADYFTNAGAINASGGTAINLGAGDDTLRLEPGYSIVGSVTAGSGVDTLEVGGALSYAASGQSFERFVKNGPGVADISNISIRTIRRPGFPIPIPAAGNFLDRDVIVEEGTLRFSGPVFLSDSTNVVTAVFGDGGVGQFASDNLMALDGDLTVNAVDNVAFADGTTYDVVSGSARSGAFDDVTLPDATPLRSFSGEYTPTGYRVTADVNAIMTVAAPVSAATTSFVQALDGATPTASGSVASAIASLQSMNSAAAVSAAVTGMAPTLSTDGLSLSDALLITSGATVDHRIASLTDRAAARAELPGGLLLSETKASSKGVVAWATPMGGGNLLPTAFDRLPGDVYGMAGGVDVQFGDALIGGSMMRLQSDGSLVDATNNGAAFASTTARLYGAALLGELGYATAAFSWGRSDVGAAVLNGVNEAAEYGFRNHNSMLGASIEAGRRFDVIGSPEIFGALTYRFVDGVASAQSSNSGLGVNVEGGQSTRLESEFGVRMRHEFKVGDAAVNPFLALSAIHRHNDETSVDAFFADMPDYRFELRDELQNENAFRAGAGLQVSGRDAIQFTASALSEVGSRRSGVVGEIRAVVKF